MFHFLFSLLLRENFCFVGGSHDESECTLENYTKLTDLSGFYDKFNGNNAIYLEIINDLNHSCRINFIEKNISKVACSFTIIGRENSSVEFLTGEKIEFYSLKITNCTFIVTSDNITSFYGIEVSLFNLKIQGKFDTAQRKIDSDLRTYAQLGNVLSQTITLYGNEKSQLLNENSVLFLNLMTQDPIICIHGFAETVEAKHDGDNISFHFVESNSTFVVLCSLEIIKESGEFYEFSYDKTGMTDSSSIMLSVENNCTICVSGTTDSENSNFMILSKTGGNINFTAHALVDQMFFENCNVSIAYTNVNCIISSISVINSTIIVNERVRLLSIKKLYFTFQSKIVQSLGSRDTLKVEELVLRGQRNIMPYVAFKVTKSFECYNSSVIITSLDIDENCRVIFGVNDEALTCVIGDCVLLPFDTIYFLKEDGSPNNLVNKKIVLFDLKSPKISWNKYKLDLSLNDQDAFGFTEETCLLEKVDEDNGIALVLTNDPAVVYPTVCYTEDICRFENAVILKPGQPLDFFKEKPSIVHIIANTTGKDVCTVNLDTLNFKTNVVLGNKRFASYIVIPITSNTYKKIENLALDQGTFEFNATGDVLFPINNLTISSDAKVIGDKIGLNLRDLELLRVGIDNTYLCDVTQPKNVDIIMDKYSLKMFSFFGNAYDLEFSDHEKITIKYDMGNKLSFAMKTVEEGCVIRKVTKGYVIPFNIIESEPMLIFDNSWEDFSDVAVEISSMYNGTRIATYSNSLPVDFKTPAIVEIFNGNPNNSIVSVSSLSADSLKITLVSEKGFSLIFDSLVINHDIDLELVETPGRNDLKLVFLGCTFSNGTYALTNVNIVDYLTLDLRVSIETRRCVFDKITLHMKAVAGEACSYISDYNSTIDIKKVEVNWKLSSNFNDPPLNVNSIALNYNSGSNKTALELIENTKFLPAKIELKHGYIQPYSWCNKTSIVYAFNCIRTSKDIKMAASSIVALIISSIIGFVAIILIIYIFMANKTKNRCCRHCRCYMYLRRIHYII